MASEGASSSISDAISGDHDADAAGLKNTQELDVRDIPDEYPVVSIVNVINQRITEISSEKPPSGLLIVACKYPAMINIY